MHFHAQILDGDRPARWDCPGTTPMPYFSNSSRLTLRFRSVGWQAWLGSAYDIAYVASDRGAGCGGDIYNYGGQISSPLYPANERTYRECTWRLLVPQNQVVALQFEVFDMGPSSTCADNYVQLFEVQPTDADGGGGGGGGAANATATEERLVRTFCGTDTPANFVAQSNRLVVRFKKTVNFAGTGWLLNFMAVQPNVIAPAY